MKVFNLTDVPTADLEKRGLVNQILVVRTVVVEPGQSAEAPDDEITRRDAQHYVSIGAIAVDVLPAGYVVAKSRLERLANVAAGRQGRSG